MKCPNCHNEIKATTKFCGFCGKKQVIKKTTDKIKPKRSQNYFMFIVPFIGILILSLDYYSEMYEIWFFPYLLNFIFLFYWIYIIYQLFVNKVLKQSILFITFIVSSFQTFNIANLKNYLDYERLSIIGSLILLLGFINLILSIYFFLTIKNQESRNNVIKISNEKNLKIFRISAYLLFIAVGIMFLDICFGKFIFFSRIEYGQEFLLDRIRNEIIILLSIFLLFFGMKLFSNNRSVKWGILVISGLLLQDFILSLKYFDYSYDFFYHYVVLIIILALVNYILFNHDYRKLVTKK